MKNQANAVMKKSCHSRALLSGIYNVCRCQTKENALLNGCVEDPRQKPSGMTPYLTGFTLIELLVVVLIIGILAAVAVPQYQMAVLKSRLATTKNVVDTWANAQELYYLSNGNYTTNRTLLDIDVSKVEASCFSVVGDVSYVSCSVKGGKGIQYQHYLRNVNSAVLANVRRCVVWNDIDLNSLANKTCQSDTGARVPAERKVHTVWHYPKP